MSIVDKIQTVAEAEDFEFFYGRRDFQNLIETDSDTDAKIYFLLDPVTSDFSMPSIPIHTGYFMLLSKSDLDEVYHNQLEQDQADGKFEKYIKDKKEYVRSTLKNLFECASMYATKLIVTDIINLYDENMDGVLVQYTIEEYI